MSKNQSIRPQQKRRFLLKLSALLMIGLPLVLSSIYYGLIASDQYATEVRFAVRGVSTGGNNELLGLVTGMTTGGSTTQDSYILMDYLHSRAFVKELANALPLEDIYGPKKADFLSSFDMSQPIEELVRYWRKMTSISYDTSSQIIIVEVRTFSPEDSKKVADILLKLSERLVNELSAKARRDTVENAKKEVQRMEKRLRAARRAVRAFREKERVIDPSKAAESRLTILAELEGKLTEERAKLSALSQFMDKKSPRIVVLTSRIQALEAQMQAERQKLGRQSRPENGKESGGPLTGLLEYYRELLTDQEFAEKAYVSALAALEAAQLDASRRQRYLATFVYPGKPEMALYPKRLLNIFLTLIISLITWAIATLIAYSVRDHAT